MQIIRAPRASAILYGLLISQSNRGPWILPANICPIVPITFLKARVPFEFVDISPETHHMDLEQVEALVRSGRFDGLLYAHTYGEASMPNDFFVALKNRSPRLMIVDDRCLCTPDWTPREHNHADVALYSTGYAKIVDLGFGGYALMRDEIPYQSMHLSFSAEAHAEIELAYKESIRRGERFIYHDRDWLDTGSPTLPWSDYAAQIDSNLAASLEHRAALNKLYAEMLPVEIQFPAAFQTWRFNIQVRQKQPILDAIFAARLFASSHYASLAGIMADGRAPRAEVLSERVINLFNDHHFTLSQAEQVCHIILDHLT